ncbi:MAG: ABC transporter ATP-binding protein [Synergistaceae bacterium]|nr:ABC transporter ATP-binding protein [Synergistaceae bacterium]
MLSEQRLIKLLIASLSCSFQNFALMLQAGLAYSFIMYMLVAYVSGFKFTDSKSLYYLGACLVCAMLLLLASWFQYNASFAGSYKESNILRVILADKVRKLPPSFVKANSQEIISALTKDCASLETIQTHFTAPFIGSVIFTAFMSLALLYTNFIMALAVLWVVPVSFGIIYFLVKYNLRSELLREILALSSRLILRLGLVTCALTGALLFSQGKLAANILLLFVITASRLYDPLEIALNNLSGVLAARPAVNYPRL